MPPRFVLVAFPILSGCSPKHLDGSGDIDPSTSTSSDVGTTGDTTSDVDPPDNLLEPTWVWRDPANIGTLSAVDDVDFTANGDIVIGITSVGDNREGALRGHFARVGRDGVEQWQAYVDWAPLSLCASTSGTVRFTGVSSPASPDPRQIGIGQLSDAGDLLDMRVLEEPPDGTPWPIVPTVACADDGGYWLTEHSGASTIARFDTDDLERWRYEHPKKGWLVAQLAGLDADELLFVSRSSTDTNCQLSRLDTDGRETWTVNWPGGCSMGPFVTANTEYAVMASLVPGTNPSPMRVVVYDLDDSLQWSSDAAPSFGIHVARPIAIADTNRVYQSSSTQESDFGLWAYDPGGEHATRWLVTDGLAASPRTIRVTTDGGILVGGEVDGSAWLARFVAP